MITPAYGLTATERVLPSLALDFTTGSLDPRVTFTRTGNTATVTNSSGVITAINADLPRFDYNPVTLAPRGLLIEEARTNLLLNSVIAGTNLSTQTVTVTAAAHTISFYGTGQIVLSGAHSATIVGTGAYPTRTTLTFTPTAGSLTVTVTGTVQFAQLELGLFASSFIPTDATTKTRNADTVSMTGTNFSSWFVDAQGTFVPWLDTMQTKGNVTDCVIIELFNSGALNNRRSSIINAATGNLIFRSVNNAGTITDVNVNSAATANPSKIAGSYNTSTTTIAESVNASTVASRNTASTPTGINTLNIGRGRNNNAYLNQCISKLLFYPQQLTNAEIQAFSK